MTTSRPIHLWLVFVLTLMAYEGVGCIQLAKRPAEKRFYTLDVSRSADGSADRPRSILKIRKLRVAAPFEGTEMIYRTGESHYQSDFYNEWLITPSTMVTDQLQNWLSHAGLFLHVVDTSSSVESAYVLEGRINSLYGDLRLNGSPKAVLAVEITLLKDGPAHEEIVFRRDYQAVTQAETASVDALVTGWNMGLKHNLTRLEEDLRSVSDIGGISRSSQGRRTMSR